jgi:hypothetical protein
MSGSTVGTASWACQLGASVRFVIELPGGFRWRGGAGRLGRAVFSLGAAAIGRIRSAALARKGAGWLITRLPIAPLLAGRQMSYRTASMTRDIQGTLGQSASVLALSCLIICDTAVLRAEIAQRRERISASWDRLAMTYPRRAAYFQARSEIAVALAARTRQIACRHPALRALLTARSPYLPGHLARW